MKLSEKKIVFEKDDYMIIESVMKTISENLYEEYEYGSRNEIRYVSKALSETLFDFFHNKKFDKIIFDKKYFLKRVYLVFIQRSIYIIDLPKVIIKKGKPQDDSNLTEIKNFFNDGSYLFVDKNLLFYVFIENNTTPTLKNINDETVLHSNNFNFNIINLENINNNMALNTQHILEKTKYKNLQLEIELMFDNPKNIQNSKSFITNASARISNEGIIQIRLKPLSPYSLYKTFHNREILKTFISALSHEWIHIIDINSSSKKGNFKNTEDFVSDTRQSSDKGDNKEDNILYIIETSELQAYSQSISDFIVQCYADKFGEKIVENLELFYKNPLKNIIMVRDWVKLNIKKSTEYEVIDRYIELKDKKLKIKIKKQGKFENIKKESIFKYVDGEKIWKKLVSYILEELKNTIKNIHKLESLNKSSSLNIEKMALEFSHRKFVKYKLCRFLQDNLSNTSEKDIIEKDIQGKALFQLYDYDEITFKIHYMKDTIEKFSYIDMKTKTITINIGYIDYDTAKYRDIDEIYAHFNKKLNETYIQIKKLKKD